MYNVAAERTGTSVRRPTIHRSDRLLSISFSYLLYYVPLIVAISLVFAGTRHEDLSLIWRHALQTGRWVTTFMGLIFVVLLVMDWMI